jgi:hypothetical protein
VSERQARRFGRYDRVAGVHEADARASNCAFIRGDARPRRTHQPQHRFVEISHRAVGDIRMSFCAIEFRNIAPGTECAPISPQENGPRVGPVVDGLNARQQGLRRGSVDLPARGGIRNNRIHN